MGRDGGVREKARRQEWPILAMQAVPQEGTSGRGLKPPISDMDGGRCLEDPRRRHPCSPPQVALRRRVPCDGGGARRRPAARPPAAADS